ncbi:MAG: DUF3857 domain-containing protein [Bacteroidota bacterium]|jgi:transglutaminase-like putative cysteine protease
MKHFITILLLSVIPFSVFAQKPEKTTTYVVGGNPSTAASEKETADAVYEQMTHEYVLQTDGTVVYTYSHRLRLLTPFAFTRAYGESFITYDPQWQKLEVLRSITTMRDGKKVESPFNAYNEVLPGFAAGAAPYLGLKEMVVTHTGVEAGAVIDFAYRLTTKPGMMPGMMGKVVFGTRSPISDMTVRVVTPTNVALEFGMVRDAGTPRITEENGTRSTEWHRTEIPIVEVEDSQPAPADFLPVLYFTSSTKQEMIRHCLQDASDADLGPAKAAVDEIVKKESDPVKRAIALQNWVIERVGRGAVPLDIIGYRAMSPSATLRANIGSDLDRAVLLAAMCRAAGLEADPVLFSGDIRSEGMRIESIDRGSHREDHILPDPRPDIASLHLYDRPAVLCRQIGEYNWLALDPSHTQSGPMLPQFWERYYIELTAAAKGPQQYPPESSVGPSVVSITSDWILADDLTVKGKSSVSASGLRSYALDTEAFKGVVKKAIAVAGQGMKVEPASPEVRTSFETVCESDVVSEKPLVSIEGTMKFEIPIAPGGVTDLHLPLGDLQRTTPIAIPGSLREECRMTLHLPKNVRAVSVPEKIEFSNAIGKVISVIKAGPQDVEVHRMIEITAPRLQAESYPMLLELLRAWRNPSHTSLLLQTQK